MAATHRDPLALLRALDERVEPAGEHLERNARTKAARSDGLSQWMPHAERVSLAGGCCVRARSRAPLTGERSEQGYLCGTAQIDFAELPGAFAMLSGDDRFKQIDPERVAYVDIETTGLGGGSGTYAFLIGVGKLRGEEFIVDQYFMEDLNEEEALIELVAQDLAEAEAIVSYNGKSFDMPILEMRWRMARRRPEFPRPHLDLLYPSRRLWRMRWEDCRLGTIEREALGIVRVSDVESFLIPQIYFDYINGLGRERMAAVVHHHAQDIFSLGALGALLARAITRPEDSRFGHAAEQWGLARMLEAAGRPEEGVAAIERAIRATRDEDFGFHLSMQLARRYKRMGRLIEAVEIWEARAAQARAGRLQPLIELAKHAEHRLGDFEAAGRWTEQAIEIARGEAELASWLGRRGGAGGGGALEALEHRRRRVQRRQDRKG